MSIIIGNQHFKEILFFLLNIIWLVCSIDNLFILNYTYCMPKGKSLLFYVQYVLSLIPKMMSIRSGFSVPIFLLRSFSLFFAIICGVIPVHADQSQSFVFVADTQGGSFSSIVNTSVLNPIVDTILALKPAPKVVIFGGDATYVGGTDSLTYFKTLFTDRLTSAGIPSAIAIGNHELFTLPTLSQPLEGQQAFQNLFNNNWTQNGPNANYNNLAFSFHLGNSLFIVADSFYATTNASYPPFSINTEQLNWITGLLQNNKAAHSFVFTHVPAYSPQNPSANADMTAAWTTITTSGNATNTNVSILFTGHEHLYYRTFHNGTYQVLSGSAGAPLSCENPGFCGPIYPGDIFAFQYNFTVVTINGRYVNVNVFDPSNNTLDVFRFFDNSGVNNATITNAITIAPDPLEKQPTGILAGSYNTITNSASISNVFTGIDAVSNNIITNSGGITPMSGGNGIHVYDNNTITNTTTGSITGNSTGLWGIRVNTGNTVVNNGTISVSGTNSIAFLAQGNNNTFTNNGTLNASGTDSYAAKFLGTGNSLVNSGTISGNLWFDAGNNTFTNNGTFNGPGGIYKAGWGTLTLSGVNACTGQSTISEGLLFLSSGASLGGTLTVNSGAEVGGYGTLSNVINNGTMSPGGSIGTLTLNGNYTQGSKGKLFIEAASPTNNDLVAINGAASLNGILQTSWTGGYNPAINTKFGAILTASSGITGQFSSLLTNITPTVLLKPKYDIPNQVYLMVERDYTNQNLLPFLTENQRAVGAMLNSVGNTATGDLNTVLTALDFLPANQTAYALDQIAPKGSEAQSGMGISSASFQAGSISDRLSDLRRGIRGMSLNGLYFKNGNGTPIMLASINPDLTGMLPSGVDERWGFFVKGNAAYGNQRDTPDRTGYDFTNTGVTMGSDYRFAGSFIGGLMLGLNTSRANVDNTGSKVKMDGYTLGAYGTYYKKSFYLDGSIGYGFANYDNTRRIVFPGLDRTATVSPNGDQFTAYGATGYDIRKNNWIITPNMSFQYTKLGIDSYTEKGAGALNLDVDKQNTESLLGNIGVRASYAWQTSMAVIMPGIRTSYGYEFSRNSQNITSRLAQGSSPFSIQTMSPDRSFISLGAGITAFTVRNMSVYINYDTQIGESKYVSHNVNAGLRLGF